MKNLPFIIWVLGWIISLLGVLFIAKPETAKWLMRFLIKGSRLYLIAAARVVLAIIYLVGASKCRIPPVILILGIILLISGIIGFAVSLNKLKEMVRWWETKPMIIIRLISVITIIFGVVTVYAALR